MESSCNPETQKELLDALDTLLVQANQNGVLINDVTPFLLTHDDIDTADWEVMISRLQD
jgi:hypothetical protein